MKPVYSTIICVAIAPPNNVTIIKLKMEKGVI